MFAAALGIAIIIILVIAAMIRWDYMEAHDSAWQSFGISKAIPPNLSWQEVILNHLHPSRIGWTNEELAIIRQKLPEQCLIITTQLRYRYGQPKHNWDLLAHQIKTAEKFGFPKEELVQYWAFYLDQEFDQTVKSH